MSERVDMYRRAVRVPFSKPGDAFAEVASSFVFGVGGHLDGYLWSSIADDGAQVLGKLAECIVAALQHAWLARVQAQSLRITKRTLKPWMKTSSNVFFMVGSLTSCSGKMERSGSGPSTTRQSSSAAERRATSR